MFRKENSVVRSIEAHTAGSGRKLLLVHGLGGSWKSWLPVLPALTAHREVIAIDLPGHGESRARPRSGTFSGLADSLESYIVHNQLASIDVAGVSLGGRLVLELARRGCVGDVVALDPGGFWHGWERTYFKWTLSASLKLLRLLEGQLGALSASRVSRTALLAQLSARPWALSSELVQRELTSFARTPTVGPLIKDLASGPAQRGPASSAAGRVTIGWGRKDRLCPPRQAARARAAFPDAAFHWFEESGHYAVWDCPQEAAELVLRSTEATDTQ
ncbi:MAG: alpha/beta hydrolase [Sphingomonadales bacterium CG12_big_fil_rev_8_21_14_0_65_65_10]|nr:MAG: alpha/beta hydrolase [Sphingomonadales bacterium CG12_big_fil_rev_8_21_14_0_65_65_10]